MKFKIGDLVIVPHLWKKPGEITMADAETWKFVVDWGTSAGWFGGEELRHASPLEILASCAE